MVSSSSSSYKRERDYYSGDAVDHGPSKHHNSRDDSRQKVERARRNSRSERDDHDSYSKKSDTRRSYSKRERDSQDKVDRTSSKKLHSHPEDKTNDRNEYEIVDLILGRAEARFSVTKYSLKDISFACRRLSNTNDIRYLDNDMLVSLLSHAIALRPNSQDISMILNELGKVVIGSEALFSNKCMGPLAELLHHLPDSRPQARHISNAINGLSKFVEHDFILPDQEVTMKVLSKLVMQLAKCEPGALNISITVLGLSKFVEQKYTLYNEKETMEALCRFVNELPDLTTNAGNIACLISGLGRIVEEKAPISQPDLTSKSLCTLVKSLAHKNPTAQEITMTIHGLSKFAECDFAFHNKEELMALMHELILLLPSLQTYERHIAKALFGLSRFVQREFTVANDTFDLLCTLVNNHYKSKPNAQDCALTVLAVSKFVERGYSLPNKEETMRTLCSLVIALPECDPNEQNISNAILGISKFIEHDYALDRAHETLVSLSKLIISLSTKKLSDQHISNALLGLSKFTERGFSLPDFDNTLNAICRLVAALPHTRPKEQEIATTIHALSKFIEHGYTLPDSKYTMEVLCRLVQRISKLNPSNQEIALTVLGLSKFADLDIPLYEPDDTMKALCTLVRRLPKTNPTQQNISNAVLGLGKLAERGYDLSSPRPTMEALSELVILLTSKNPSQQGIAITLLGLSKIVDREYSLPGEEKLSSAISTLVIQLAGKETIAQDISLTLHALSKFVKEGYISQTDELNKAVYTLSTSLLHTTLSSKHISTTIFALIKLIALHDPYTYSNILGTLLLQLPQKKPTAHDIAITVFGLSAYIEAGCAFENENEVMQILYSLVKRLATLDPNPQEIALTMRGIATMYDRGCKLPSEKIVQILLPLFTSIPYKNPSWQSIHSSFKALCLLIKQKKVAYASVQETITLLLPFLEKPSYQNVSICQLLFTLSEMGFVDKAGLANTLIKKVSFRGKQGVYYLAQEPLTHGILGYARLMSDNTEEHGIALLIRRAQKRNLHTTNLLALIQAHAIFKEKGADNIAKHIDIARLQKALLAKDPTPEEKRLAGITEVPIDLPAKQEAATPVAGLVQMTNQAATLKAMAKPASYDLTTKLGQSELKAFLQTQGIEYVAEEAPFVISPVFVIQNQLGAFAKKELRPNQVLGNYVGNLVEGEDAIKESMYAFYVGDGPDGQEQFIDARYKRNFAAFFNHSNCFNVNTTTSKNVVIGFEVANEPILANEQCFITYGDDFFPLLGFEPLFLDSKDSWESFDQLVLQNKDAYCQNTAYVSEELQKVFRMPTQKVLLSKLSQAILLQNEKEALRLVDSQADLWSYCVDGTNELMPPQKQQRISALMLACYLGQTTVVEALLKKANKSARLLQTGETAATFALKGQNKNCSTLFKMLYDQGIYYNLTNREGVHFLNIAVEENLPEVVQLLLDGKPAQVRKELLEIFANSQTDSMYLAIMSGKVEALKALLKHTTQSWLAPLIVDRAVLVLKALEETTHFDAAISALIESGNIHKNFAVVKAICTRFGSKANNLLKKALDAKQWPAKERERLENMT